MMADLFSISKRVSRNILIGFVALFLTVGFYYVLGFSPERWIDVSDKESDQKLTICELC